MNRPHSLQTILSRLLLAVIVTISSGISTGPLLLAGSDEAHAQTDQALLPHTGYFVAPYLKAETGTNGPEYHKPLHATFASRERETILRPRFWPDHATSIHHVSPLIITQSSSSDL